ncbi:helix-turn-helix domain-containing protein [uncultured Sphingomonas sp.]|uniref:helix-turn-helix domain-containing protein n=1 Tax=uncultured Sphingomonas sp. TaxID=158754 RepID=UPI0025E981DD|nr:helix-turn-helix domain-containing protein [uncultured Sphingomonas sp.]
MINPDVKTAMKLVGVSRTSIYKLISLGVLEKKPVLGRTFITRESVDRLLAAETLQHDHELRAA